MANQAQRLDKLEREIIPEIRRPSYISISDDQWSQLQSGIIDPADLGIDRPIKVYIGSSPDDWDDND